MEEESLRTDGGFFDGFSDFLIHEIFSFLPIKDLAITSFVSKRFRYLCLTVPDLHIDSRPFKNQLNRQRLSNWIDRFLFLRQDSKIRSFSVKWFCEDTKLSQLFRFDTWIHNAVRSRVEEFDLTINATDQYLYPLPLCVFACKSIRVFKFKLIGGCALQLPSNITSYCFSSVHVLSIPKVQVDIELPANWVSSLFPSLKVLNLDDGILGCKNLYINTSSLETLSISVCKSVESLKIYAPRLHDLSVNWCYRESQGSSNTNISCTIFTPKLENFKWEGYIFYPTNYCFFECLKTAKIWSLHHMFGSHFENLPRNCLLGLLHIVSQAKSVELGRMFMEVVFLQDSLPPLLDNVQNLYIEVLYLKDDRVAALASFLKRFPNLQTLTIKSCDAYRHCVQPINPLFYDYWESQHLPFIHQLKVAKIEIMGIESEVELVKYLIKHGRALEKMIVTVSTKRPRRIRGKISKFKNTHNRALHLVLK